MPSSSAVKSRWWLRYRQREKTKNGSSRSRTTASALPLSTRMSSSPFFSGCTRAPNIPETAWGWRSARKLWSSTAGGFGWTRRLARVPHFDSRFRLFPPMTRKTVTDMPEILLVDDNPADSDLTWLVLARSTRPNHISAVYDGEQAMAFLHRSGKHANAVRPQLVVLDLNLPRK